MTVEEFFAELGRLVRDQLAGEISEAQSTEKLSDLVLKARLEMDDTQFSNIQHYTLSRSSYEVRTVLR